MEGLPRILTIEDIMEHLGIQRASALKLFRLDSFPSIKLGKKYIITEEEYLKWFSKAKNTEIDL